MMNLQELQTIRGNRLPIKIFLLNNGGYHSIRQTQKAYFADNLIGIDPATGVSLPNWERIAYGFDIPYWRAARLDGLDDAIAGALAAEGPQFCEIVLDPEQPFSPRVASRRLEDGSMVSSPLEDMSPFLSREELAQNMIGEDEQKAVIPLALPPAIADSLRSSEARILVTGAGGWIGSATLELLAQALGPEGFRRRVRAFASRSRSLALRGGVSVELAGLEKSREGRGRPGDALPLRLSDPRKGLGHEHRSL